MKLLVGKKRQSNVHFFRQTTNSSAKTDNTLTEDPFSKIRRLEAVLFLSRDPVPARKLAQLADLKNGKEATQLIKILNRRYDEIGKAFRVEKIAGGYQQMTRSELSSWLKRFKKKAQISRLSTPAMETLAVVAYRQPVIRVDIESIRGVSCGEMLRQLMEADMVRISGRSEELGRPYLYSTTRNFLKAFGLNNLNDLPITKSMKATVSTTESDLETLSQEENSTVSIAATSSNEESQLEEGSLTEELELQNERTELDEYNEAFDELDDEEFLDDEEEEEEEEEEENEEYENDEDDLEDDDDDLDDDEDLEDDEDAEYEDGEDLEEDYDEDDESDDEDYGEFEEDDYDDESYEDDEEELEDDDEDQTDWEEVEDDDEEDYEEDDEEYEEDDDWSDDEDEDWDDDEEGWDDDDDEDFDDDDDEDWE